MTKTPFTMTTMTQAVVFSRKDRAVKAGMETGESFTVMNPNGEIVHEHVVDNTTPEDRAVAQELNDTMPEIDQEDSRDSEHDGGGDPEDLLGEQPVEVEEAPAKEEKPVPSCSKTDEWVDREGNTHTGPHGPHKVTGKGHYCYPCDRIVAERQKAERRAAKEAERIAKEAAEPKDA